MPPAATLTVYCIAIVAISLAGGWLPMLMRLTHRRMEIALSFISGIMLGVASLLLLPHAFAARVGQGMPPAGEEAHEVAHRLFSPLMLWMLAGFLAMFFIERFFCFHHHEAPDSEDTVTATACTHAAGHEHEHAVSPHALTWSGAAIGLTLHSLLDGVALAASVAAAHERGFPAGLGTFLVVLLHKPFDSLTLGTLMAASQRSRALRHVVNLSFALLVPVGAGLFMLGLASSNGAAQLMVLSATLAFAAGTFLCIALSDVLPELQFHQHDRIKLSLALVLGLVVAWGIAELEARTHAHAEHEHLESSP